MDMYSNNPLERTLAALESYFFSINDRAAEYARLMDAIEEVMKVDINEESNVNRCFSSSYHHYNASNNWGSEKVQKFEFKELPARLNYAFLFITHILSYSILT